MWVPRTAEELVAALPTFAESASLDAKGQLPDSGKNDELAKDVAAMTVDGGTLIFGVAEDKARDTFEASPVPLAGAVERITSVVQSKVGGSPQIEAFSLSYGEEVGHGFVVVCVPPSPRAPHMVEAKGEMRFYGRAPGGNIRLGQGDVDRLYERRERVQRDCHKAFDDWMDAAPFDRRGSFGVTIGPVLSDRGLLARAWPGEQKSELVQALIFAEKALTSRVVVHLGVMRLVDTRMARTMDGWDITEDGSQQRALGLTVGEDGTVACIFKGAVGPYKPVDETYLAFWDRICVQLGAQILYLAGAILERARYFGAVDMMFDVQGHEGAVGVDWLDPNNIPPMLGYPRIAGTMHGELQVPASALTGNEWASTAKSLFGKMNEVTGPAGRTDFFGC